eukprot:932412_1
MVTYHKNDYDSDHAWPHFIWYSGGTFCQTTMMWMEFIAGEMLIASVFSNSPFLNLIKPVNDAIMVNDIQKGLCELTTTEGEEKVTSDSVLDIAYELIEEWRSKETIEVQVNCDNFLDGIWFKDDLYSEYVQLSLKSGDDYPLDDWTKTQIITVQKSRGFGKIMIQCANAAHDDGPAGLMFSIKYKNKFISSNIDTINGKIVTLLNTTGNNNNIVISSQSSTTKLSKDPYNAKWIWTCGHNGEWNCGEGVVNVFELDLGKLDIVESPNYSSSTGNTFFDTINMHQY